MKPRPVAPSLQCVAHGPFIWPVVNVKMEVHTINFLFVLFLPQTHIRGNPFVPTRHELLPPPLVSTIINHSSVFVKNQLEKSSTFRYAPSYKPEWRLAASINPKSSNNRRRNCCTIAFWLGSEGSGVRSSNFENAPRNAILKAFQSQVPVLKSSVLTSF